MQTIEDPLLQTKWQNLIKQSGEGCQAVVKMVADPAVVAVKSEAAEADGKKRKEVNRITLKKRIAQLQSAFSILFL
ncbi:hypothetical protein [Ureibacillus acetophenoni]